MNKTFPALLAALLLAPLALASDNPLPKNYCEDPWEWGTHYYVTSYGLAFLVLDGNMTQNCSGAGGPPTEYDGHMEWGLGGAFLTVATGHDDCAVEFPHHTSSIHVEDRVFGFGAGFFVGVDYGVDPVDPANPCDGIDDNGQACVGWCSPPFPPGSDGAYHIYVDPGSTTKGHVTTA